ncbi:MAG: hypothetical protein ABQ298_09615 [Puniceicoccaceae bacterium]
MDPEISETVANTIWKWQNPPVQPTISNRKLRSKALLPITMLLIGFVLMRFGFKHDSAAWVLLLLAGAVGMIALFAPRRLCLIERFGKSVARLAGIIMTYLLLVPFYVGVLGCMRMLFAIRNRDPLHRKWDCSGSSYWIDRSTNDAKSHLDRPF